MRGRSRVAKLESEAGARVLRFLDHRRVGEGKESAAAAACRPARSQTRKVDVFPPSMDKWAGLLAGLSFFLKKKQVPPLFIQKHSVP
jgi:hypothetical protein